MLDRKKLAVIHITKKELALSDDEYRDLLEKATGKRSAKDLDEAGFRRLMRYFARSSHYRTDSSGITFRQRLYIKHLLDDLAWDANHLRNFVHKYYHKEKVEFLTKQEASKLIEALKHIITRQLSRP